MCPAMSIHLSIFHFAYPTQGHRGRLKQTRVGVPTHLSESLCVMFILHNHVYIPAVPVQSPMVSGQPSSSGSTENSPTPNISYWANAVLFSKSSRSILNSQFAWIDKAWICLKPIGERVKESKKNTVSYYRQLSIPYFPGFSVFQFCP